LSTAASLTRHREKYCRYRDGKKAKSPAVARQRGEVEIDDEYEFWGDTCCVYRTQLSVKGRAHDFVMLPTIDVYDVGRWLYAEEAVVRNVFDRMDEFLVKYGLSNATLPRLKC